MAAESAYLFHHHRPTRCGRGHANHAFLYYQTRRPRGDKTLAQRQAVRALRLSGRRKLPHLRSPVTVRRSRDSARRRVRPVEKGPEIGSGNTIADRKALSRQGRHHADAIAKASAGDCALDPGNPEVLAELALTYESMQLFDRSNEVSAPPSTSLGPAAGPLYQLGRALSCRSAFQLRVPRLQTAVARRQHAAERFCRRRMVPLNLGSGVE